MKMIFLYYKIFTNIVNIFSNCKWLICFSNSYCNSTNEWEEIYSKKRSGRERTCPVWRFVDKSDQISVFVEKVS